MKIDNVDFDKISKTKDRGIGFKLVCMGVTGTMIASMLTGCIGIKGRYTPDPTPPAPITLFEEGEENTDTIYLNSDFTDESLEELAVNGENIRNVHISYSFYIEDLSTLAEYCPNIEVITIEYSPSISDLSFIYSLPNLQKFYVRENGYVTPELVDYLDKHGIEHNITQSDLENAEELDRIIDEIITDDMTDEEKIQAITNYVITNFEANMKYEEESNERPLSSMLENRGGVCASFAYLENILLRKAGITSYEIVTNNRSRSSPGHAWNMVEIDGKYYYIDTTNISQIPFVSEAVLEHFNIGFNYMSDPRATGLSEMVDFDNAERITIPQTLIEDIERGESMKNLIEKHGNSVPARIIEMVVAITAVSTGLLLAANGIKGIQETVSSRKLKKARMDKKKKEALRRKQEEARRKAARNSYRNQNRRYY